MFSFIVGQYMLLCPILLYSTVLIYFHLAKTHDWNYEAYFTTQLLYKIW